MKKITAAAILFTATIALQFTCTGSVKNFGDSYEVRKDLNPTLSKSGKVSNVIIRNSTHSGFFNNESCVAISFMLKKTNLQDDLNASFDIVKDILEYMKQNNYLYYGAVIKVTYKEYENSRAGDAAKAINSEDILRISIPDFKKIDYSTVKTMDDLIRISQGDNTFIRK